MKVLMFGWEFPPYHYGGLGVACHGIVKGLSNNGVEVTFVVPRMADEIRSSYAKVVSADIPSLKVHGIKSLLHSYMSPKSYVELAKDGRFAGLYGNDLFEEVRRYALRAREIALQESFDVIHAHDWMTYRAGMEAKRVSSKPLVMHVHATEFDRTGDHPNQQVYDLEREGFHSADALIAVSNFTKNKIVERYGVDERKVHVVHNAIEQGGGVGRGAAKKEAKLVLFLGRITLQKGPDYFLYAAKKVLEKEPDARFMIAGSGDMQQFLIEKAAELGIGDKVFFSGFLKGDEIKKAYNMAGVYVMPSVSEPFGLTALEAMSNDVPLIISKQSGVSEVVNHCLRVDFWDVHQLANKIVGVLRYPCLRDSLRENAGREISKFDWANSAAKCIDVYKQVLGGTAW